MERGRVRAGGGSGALSGGECGAAVEGGNGVGGFASVREPRAGEGGRDGGTDGRREPREAPAPPRSAALGRPMELCPGPAPPSGWALPLLLALGAAGLGQGTPHLPYSRPGSRSK